MEDFGLYLLKSVIWLSGFSLVYLIFLRNERYFELNRMFLLTGLLTSLIFPFISISYSVYIPSEGIITASDPVLTGITEEKTDGKVYLSWLLSGAYIIGVLLFILKNFQQNRSVLKAIKGSEVISHQPVKLVRTHEYPASFSFFSFVFVNPSITDIETNEILNHEMVHIRQKHWIDLILAELVCIMQWFNPLVWVYSRLIKQNHEYLADKVALQQTSDPAIYRATLLNQIIGQPVVDLANSFNYSLNNKRFNMMKKIISSPYRKLKLLLILPAAAIILFSFATPEYKQISDFNNANNLTVAAFQQNNIVKGLIQFNNEPLPGATVLISGTTVGTISDTKGFFELRDVKEGSKLIVTFVGLKSTIVEPLFTKEMVIKMVRDTINYGSSATSGSGKKNIEKDNKQVENSDTKSNRDPFEEKFYIVEDMPEFIPGGQEGMNLWFQENMKYPSEAVKNKISGKVIVSYVINSNGEVKDVKVVKSVNPLLDAEAVRLISSMPKWKPGYQRGKAVTVAFTTPVVFELKP